ncbi:MAG: DUF3365 domain-containing protein [Candidatus Brocadiales bacterium]
MKRTLITAVAVMTLSLSLAPKATAFDKWGNLNVEEARTIVKLLDDVYKFWIVFDTRDHVENMGRIPSATVSKEVFAEMEKKGWHSGRIITATKNFFNPDNRPKDDFEKEAIQALKGGTDSFDRVEVVEGKKVLRAATPVPMVMKECKMCHVNAKANELMGALVYSIPLAE